MGNIKIGTNIALSRKEKGVTQEELAKHLGVSKPAVSKWESGQSYPDILLLPVIAAYFDVSVDELIGYEPQMETEDIRKLYRRLANAFARDPFDQVYAECNEYRKKYYSCWRLQIQMGLLLINHVALAGTQERMNQILNEALDIFIRVEKESGDVNLAKQSIQLQALCYFSLQKPTEVINLLEDFSEPLMSTDTLLVRAYQMKGDHQKAIEILQGNAYISLLNMLGSCSDFLNMYAEDFNRMKACYQKFLDLGTIFEVEQLHPYVLMTIHLTAAQIFASQGKNDNAFDAIEAYLELFKQTEKEEFHLKGNDFFDALEGYLSSIDIDTAAPRNGEAIRNDLKNAIIANPAFAVLETEERFQRIKKKCAGMGANIKKN